MIGAVWDGGEWEMQGSVCVTVPDSDEASGVRRFAEGAADTWAQLAGLQEFRQTKGRMTMPTTADLLRWETEGLAALHLVRQPRSARVFSRVVPWPRCLRRLKFFVPRSPAG